MNPFLYLYSLNYIYVYKFLWDFLFKFLYSLLSVFFFFCCSIYYKNYLLFFILTDFYTQMDYINFSYSKPYEIFFVFLELCFIFSFLIVFPFALILFRFSLLNMCTVKENRYLNHLIIYFFIFYFLLNLCFFNKLLPYVWFFYNSYNFDIDYIYLQRDSRLFDILYFYLNWFLFFFYNSFVFFFLYVFFVLRKNFKIHIFIKWKNKYFLFFIILLSFLNIDKNWIIINILLNFIFFEIIIFFILLKENIKKMK